MSSIMYKSKHKPSFSVCFVLSYLYFYIFFCGGGGQEKWYIIFWKMQIQSLWIERGECTNFQKTAVQKAYERVISSYIFKNKK